MGTTRGKLRLSKILNRVIDEERRKYQNSLSDSEKREVKKQLRWFLLKRKKNLSKSGESRLKELKETNKLLYELYLLKEDFLSIFDRQKSVLAGLHEIIDWIVNIQDG